MEVGANLTVDTEHTETQDPDAMLIPLPETPSREPASKKGRCGDSSSSSSEDVNPDLAMAIISSLKTVINDRADMLDKGIEGLQASVEFITNEIKDIKCNADHTEKRVVITEKKITELERKVAELERYKRRWNLRLYGLSEQQGENVRQRAMEVCKAVVPSLAHKADTLVDTVHRLGKLEKATTPRSKDNTASDAETNTTTTRPRGIILQFTMRYFRDAVWKAAKKNRYLSGNNLRFAEDLSPSDRESRQQLWPLVEKARAAGHRAYYTGAKAFVDGEELTPTLLESILAK